MIALWFDLLFMPFSATVAGFVLWLSTGKKELDDSRLLREFVILLAGCLLLLWGISRTDSARMILDPQFRLQTELDTQPVYAAVQQSMLDDHKILHDFLVRQMSQGATLPEAMLLARSLLTRMGNERLGFADQKTRIAWGQVTVDTLKELQARDPALCYRAIAAQALDTQTLSQGFSAGNNAAFQQAVAAVYDSASRGIRNEKRPDDRPVEFNAAAREYHVISDDVAGTFGESVATALGRKVFPEQPAVPAGQMCAARILQLEAMLERPQGMAAMLVDSVLR